MILVIPAIEIKNGLCSVFIKGEKGTETFYHNLSDNPIELLQLWRRENAKSIHIIDFDSLSYNEKFNIDIFTFLAQSIDIPIQVISNFNSVVECRYLLDFGVYRIIFDELALIDPDGVEKLIRDYSASRIVFNCFTDNGMIKFKRFKKRITDTEYVNYIRELGATRIIYGDKNWEDNTKGPDAQALMRISEESRLKITIANGISNVRQLWELESLQRFNIDSAIIGKPLYENKFPCQKIWRLIEAEVEKIDKNYIQ